MHKPQDLESFPDDQNRNTPAASSSPAVLDTKNLTTPLAIRKDSMSPPLLPRSLLHLAQVGLDLFFQTIQPPEVLVPVFLQHLLVDLSSAHFQ